MPEILSTETLTRLPVVPTHSLAQAAGTDVVAEHVAERLDADGWCVLDGLGFDSIYLDALGREVELLHTAGSLRAAAIGRGRGKTLAEAVRNDSTAWLDGQSEAQAALFRRLGEIQLFLNRTLYLGLTHFEAHFAAFEPGGFYRPHRDSFQGKASRLVSLVLYLNDEWAPESGGELRIFDKQGAIATEVLPAQGRAAIFLSEEVLHEVCPANRRRYSIACWFRADDSENLLFMR